MLRYGKNRYVGMDMLHLHFMIKVSGKLMFRVP